MCDPVSATIAAVSAASTIGGSIINANNQAKAAQAQMNAVQTAQQAQETGFFARNTAQQAQTAADLQTQTGGTAQKEALDAAAYNAQSQAIKSQTDTTNQINQLIAGQQGQADNSVSQALAATSAPALAAAQQQATAARASAMDPNANAIAVTNPIPGSASSGPEAAGVAARMTEAANRTKQYGDSLATIEGYNQPVIATNLAGQNLATGVMPNAEAVRLLQSSAQPLLLPSQVAFTNAGETQRAGSAAIDAQTQAQLGINQAQANTITQPADLRQNYTTVAAQNAASLAQYQAATNPWGALLSGAGQLGMYAAGGGASSLGSIFSPAARAGAVSLTPTAVADRIK